MEEKAERIMAFHGYMIEIKDIIGRSRYSSMWGPWLKKCYFLALL